MISQTGTYTRRTAVAILAILGIALICSVPANAATSRDYGDAPEGVLAYPSSGVIGQFPTCTGVGPAAWVEHNGGTLYFGPKVDKETDGNGGQCPVFEPGAYDRDEGFGDGDAGLIKPRAYSIKSVNGTPTVYPLVTTGLETIANACYGAIWGGSIDINVHNDRRDGQPGYVNLLIDWNQDGKWGGTSSLCSGKSVPEHVLVNFPVPAGYSGPLSALGPADFLVGPNAGYVWARFTITERPVQKDWTGDGIFDDGETEDYLLAILGAPPASCSWTEGDPYKMHWPQLPDLQSTGVTVGLGSVQLADDFRCMASGPITDIHFWGAFQSDILPAHGMNAVALTLKIYSNVPPDDVITWSRPGQLLWSKKIDPFTYDVSLKTDSAPVGWYDPDTRRYGVSTHRKTYQYNICLDREEDQFVQTFGTTYWLAISATPDPNGTYAFGWNTAKDTLQWNDSSAWYQPTYGWLPMAYPDTHQNQGRLMDLAFVINGSAANEDFGDAPDPPYPTVRSTGGASHTIDGKTYLGRGVDGEADGQPNSTATGDDLAGLDDEDGVVFTTDLVPGQKATVEVTASTVGALNAWIDFNGDGDWDDLGEQVFVDVTLAPGVNTLTVSVPTDAVPGRTFSRWRFSTVRGLRYTGPAPDGEVEDHMLTIAGGSASTAPVTEHLKWSQPALEQDPRSITPAYFGWNEPAYVSKSSDTATAAWQLVADDFRCIGTMPVSSVHWWGSYQRWSDTQAPRTSPQSWRIGFWSNIGVDTKYPFSRPGNLLWVVTVPAGRVAEQWVGVEEFPSISAYKEACFSYSLELQPQEYFWQNNYINSTTDSVFWVSITAVYSGMPAPENPWGWQTRPRSWMDGAVTFNARQKDLTIGTTADPSLMTVLSSSAVCQQREAYDMAFELNTDPAYIKWEQAFTGSRDWAYYQDEKSVAVTSSSTGAAKWNQEPDLTGTGIDVDATADLPQTWPNEIVADDFQCTAAGAVTRITVWGSWNNDILPNNDPEYVTFMLTIRQDIPAGQGSTHYSMPGRILWQKEFTRGTFTVQRDSSQTQSYYSPTNSTYEQSNHRSVYKYVFDIDSREAFQQTGSTANPVVYWLSVQADVLQLAGSAGTRFGWKTSSAHWNDSGTWVRAGEPYSGSSWQELLYPSKHPYATRPIDLAFAIETRRGESGLTYQQIAADDWQCTADVPVTGIAWWGSYIGYEYTPGQCDVMAAPRRPDYFLLSIWTNVADADPTNPKDFSHPGEKIWEFTATDFDEVMVGFDKRPDVTEFRRMGPEPVYRYTIRLPKTDYFWQKTVNGVYWLSIAAVYSDSKSMVYPWGWTNHERTAWGGPALETLAHWKLDESSGTTAADSSGNGNDGTITGNPTWLPAGGRIGGALDFDGRSYVKVAHANKLNFAPGSFSVSTWVYPREVGRLQALVEYDRSSPTGNRFGLWIDTNGRFQFRVGSSVYTSQQSLKAGAWCLLTGVYDSSTRQMKLYVNGQVDRIGSLAMGYATPMAAKLTIGVRGSEDSELFNGLLDDMRIYGSALSADDIQSLFDATKNDNAVAGTLSTDASTWQWVELFDQAGGDEDLSFMLFTEPQSTGSNGDSEIIFRSPSADVKTK
jgi:hypothetical protein